jgi:hypothetical protein
MFHAQLDNDLAKLEKIAEQQGGKLNLSTITLSINPDGELLQNILAHFNKKGIEIIYSDIEPDSVEKYESGIEPFDPTKINIRMDRMTIDSIVKRIANEEFEFDSEFQRKAGLWSKVQKSQLIESMLLRIPLPAFYFDASDDDKWLIIDGLQRISTIRNFMVDKNMILTGMEFFADLDGGSFDSLPRFLQRRIEETNIIAYIVDPSTPLNAKFNIFKRINTGGLTLEPQEIRNALFQGVAARFIRELSETDVFRVATCGSIPSERMLDREYCLRYIAFNYLPLEDYNGVTDDFLNIAMSKLGKMTENELREIKRDFERALTDCYAILGNHAFRKMAIDGRRRPINKTLFEGWTYCISRLNQNDIDVLKLHKENIKTKFIELCEENLFLNALKASDRGSLNTRIHKIENLINGVIHESTGGDRR